MFLNRLIARLNQIPLWLLGLLMTAGTLVFPVWFPLLPHAGRVPLSDIRTFAPSPAAGFAYALLLAALFGVYGLAASRVQNSRHPPGPGKIAAMAVFLALPLLLTYPINANDVYRYFIRGRISSIYRASPFALPPSHFADDPFLPLAGEWMGATSPYGPIWEMTAAAVTRVAGDGLIVGLVLFKSLALLLHLAVGFLLFRWAQEREHDRLSPTTLLLLWCWNPALLFTFAVNAHNDVLMLCWLLAGARLMDKGRYSGGFLVMVLAPLTKPIGLLPLPLFWLAAMRTQQGRKRALFILATVTGGLLLAGLAFLPFGSPLNLGRRLLQEATATGGFSPVALLILGARRLDLPLPALSLIRGGQLLFFSLAAWLAGRVWYGRFSLQQTNRAVAHIFVVYLLTAVSFRIWYTTWIFPWFLLNGSARQRRWSLLLLVTAQFSVLIYGHLRVFGLAGSQTAAHLLGVPFTFALPFLLTSGVRDSR